MRLFNIGRARVVKDGLDSGSHHRWLQCVLEWVMDNCKMGWI